jgi:hypothetical protein
MQAEFGAHSAKTCHRWIEGLAWQGQEAARLDYPCLIDDGKSYCPILSLAQSRTDHPHHKWICELRWWQQQKSWVAVGLLYPLHVAKRARRSADNNAFDENR